jgi:hypothetical protein
MKNQNIFKFLLVCVLSYTVNFTQAQSSEENDMSDVLEIKSPSPIFKSISLQTYNGLPRFGVENNYRFRDKYGSLKDNKFKVNLLAEGRRNYLRIVEMKFLAPYFKDIDKTGLTNINSNREDDKKKINSKIAQEHLLRLTYELLSLEGSKKYFCNEQKDPNCKYSKNKSWSAITDQFEQQEKYVAFVNENLDVLQNWSASIFENEFHVGYLVTAHTLEQYDFENEGYWVRLPSRRIEPKPYSGATFLPKGEIENNYFNRINDPKTGHSKVLLPMNTAQAEAYQNSRETSLIYRNKPSKVIYSVIKIRITYREISQGNILHAKPIFTFNFEDPNFEFYQNMALTKKIGEISLENPIYNKK